MLDQAARYAAELGATPVLIPYDLYTTINPALLGQGRAFSLDESRELPEPTYHEPILLMLTRPEEFVAFGTCDHDEGKTSHLMAIEVTPRGATCYVAMPDDLGFYVLENTGLPINWFWPALQEVIAGHCRREPMEGLRYRKQRHQITRKAGRRAEFRIVDVTAPVAASIRRKYEVTTRTPLQWRQEVGTHDRVYVRVPSEAETAGELSGRGYEVMDATQVPPSVITHLADRERDHLIPFDGLVAIKVVRIPPFARGKDRPADPRPRVMVASAQQRGREHRQEKGPKACRRRAEGTGHDASA